MTQVRRGARALLTVLWTQLPRVGLRLASGMVLGRLIAPGDFGLVAMCGPVVVALGALQDFGFTQATIQREHVTGPALSLALYATGALSLTTFAVAWIFAPAVAAFYDEPAVTSLLRAAALAFPLAALGSQHRALLIRDMRFELLTGVELSAQAIALGAATWAALAGYGPWALIVQSLGTASIATTAYWIASGWRPGAIVWNDEARDMVRFGADVSGFAIVNFFARQGDDLIIGRTQGDAALGQYTRAYELFTVPLRQLSTPVSSVALPVLSRAIDAADAYRRWFLGMLTLVWLPAAWLGAVFVAVGDSLLLTVYGPAWGEAAHILRILGVSLLWQPISHAASWLFLSQGRSRDLLRWSLFSSGLAIASFVAGVPWGARGVATAYVVAGTVIAFPMLQWFVHRSGAVRSRDVITWLGPLALSIAVGMGLALLARPALTGLPDPVIAACGAAIVTLGTVVAIAVQAAGRARVRLAWRMLREARRRSGEPVAKASSGNAGDETIVGKRSPNDRTAEHE